MQPGVLEGTDGGRESVQPRRSRAHYCCARAGVETGGLWLPRLWWVAEVWLWLGSWGYCEGPTSRHWAEREP